MMTRFDAAKVRDDKRVLDVMWALERGGAEIALVVDPDERLRGIFTDGDVRRLLLRGVALQSPLAPHLGRPYFSVSPLVPRAEVLELMQARTLGQVPVVDEGGRLVGLHLLHDLIGAVERPNAAVIMAGGRGTRLLPLTERVPKPMLPVAGRPILERIVLHVMSFGVRRIYLAINYLGHVIEEHFGDGRRLGCRIEYLRESQPLGTGGALRLLPERPAQALLVMNGDLVTQANLSGLLEFQERGPQLGTMGVRRYVHTVPFGCVTLRGDTIVRCEEKPQLTRAINTGIYALSPQMLDRIPPDQDFGLPTLFADAAARGELVRAYSFEEDWIDVGHQAELSRAQGQEET
jgi:dTDP-glucose pyrophosphorylase